MQYKVKSDYTVLRKKKQRISDGSDIFENNLMTISPMDDLFASDQSIVPSSSNFKFSVRTGWNETKRHARRGWLLSPNGNENWNMGSVSATSMSDESVIRIKPDYSSLRDFAYYGSALKMVQAAVNDVILRFPAELYFSPDIFPLSPNYRLIHNGYGINADTIFQNDTQVDNPLRYLCLAGGNYDFYENGKLVQTGVTFEIQSDINDCPAVGKIIATATTNVGLTIYTYQKGADKWLIYEDEGDTGKSIRPCQEAIDNFFNEIDDFEYVLLNRGTRPVYRASFETPYETDYGNYYNMQDYIWPSFNNWNPDVETAAYSKYLDDLVRLANFHDQYDSDNLWRMQTHEAIKNLDWTFFREKGDSAEDMSKIDSSKIEAILQLYGRNFDGVKRYIDNVKNTTNVSYNEKNNIPDYHLTEVAELEGWEVLPPNPTGQTAIYSDTKYTGRSNGWNATESNIVFVRNLKLNSRYLNSLRGTRNGLHTMLGLLGIHRDEYTIDETVAIAKGTGNYCDFLSLHGDGSNYGETLTSKEAAEMTNCPLTRNIASILLGRDSSDAPGFGDNEGTDESYLNIILGATSVKSVTVDDSNGNVAFRYCVPWYDKTVNYDGGWYFQSKGGWGKRKQKEINYPELTKASAITSTDNLVIYEESMTYLKFAASLDELTSFNSYEIKAGTVCYVTNLDGLSETYSKGKTEWQDTEIQNGDELSHYFILKDFDLSTVLGTNDGKRYGWKYIPLFEIRKEEITDADALKVVYLETLKEQTEGNNPHNGFGEYDFGAEYKEYIANPFKYLLEHSGFTSFTKSDVETGIAGYHYEINDVVDNKKCWFFSNLKENYTDRGGAEKECCGELVEDGNLEMGVPNETFEWQTENDGMNCTIVPISALKATPAATQGVISSKFSETAADSVINLKNVKITFQIPEILCGNEEAKAKWKEYIDTVVIEYVKQMLPSTTIWEYEVRDDKWCPQPDAIFVEPEVLDFNAAGGSADISVSANTDWNAVSTLGSLNITEGGSGGTLISLGIEENTSIVPKTGSILFTAGLAEATISISQEGKVERLSIDPSELDFDYNGETKEVAISSNSEWQLDGKPSWVSVEPISGSFDKSISITAQVNEFAKSRAGAIIYETTEGGLKRTLHVRQSGAPEYLKVEPDVLSFEYTGATEAFIISANTSWQINAKPEWVELDVLDGTGNKEILVTPLINESTETRDDLIEIISDGGKTAEVSVQQFGRPEHHISCIPDEGTIDAVGGTLELYLNSEGDWTATTSDSFFRFRGFIGEVISGTAGETTLQLLVNPNDAKQERTGEIVFTNDDRRTAQYTFTQEAGFLTIEPKEANVGYGGETIELTVSSSTSGGIAASSSTSFISVDKTGFNTGATTLTATVSANEGETDRIGMINAQSVIGFSDSCTIRQAAKKYIKLLDEGGNELSAMTVSARGGKYPIQIQSNDSWKAEFDKGLKSLFKIGLSFESGNASGPSGTTSETLVIPKNDSELLTKSGNTVITADSDSSVTWTLNIAQQAASSGTPIPPPTPTGQTETAMPTVTLEANMGANLTFKIENPNPVPLTSVTFSYDYKATLTLETKTKTVSITDNVPANGSVRTNVTIETDYGSYEGNITTIGWSPKTY